MRDGLTLALLAVVAVFYVVAQARGHRLDQAIAERDTLRATVDALESRAALDRATAERAQAENMLTTLRLAEVRASTPERVVVYRERSSAAEPLPATCGPGPERVDAVNAALRSRP